MDEGGCIVRGFVLVENSSNGGGCTIVCVGDGVDSGPAGEEKCDVWR